MRETPASITAIIQGKTFREAQIFNEKSFIKLRPVREELNWMILHANADLVELSSPGNSPISVPYLLIDHSNQIVNIPAGSTEAQIVNLVDKYGFIAARDIATMLNLAISWNGATRTVTIA